MPVNTHRNVVLICLDSVRKDYFDSYAPRLRKAADVSYTQCRAASSWSTPSHASMFTGMLPHQHGIHTHHRDFSSLSREDTFLDRLDEYRAIGVSANPYASSTYGFDDFFDSFTDINPTRRHGAGLDVGEFATNSDRTGLRQYMDYVRAALRHDYPTNSIKNGISFLLHRSTADRGPLPKLVDAGASAVLRTVQDQITQTTGPFVAFLNIMDAHEPFQHVYGFNKHLHNVSNSWSSKEYDLWELIDNPHDHEEYWYHRRSLYAAAIEYIDRQVIEFVEWLVNDSQNETTVIVTADHGENLGTEADEYLPTHVGSLSEAILHVPLYLFNPPSGYTSKEDAYFSHLKLGRLVVGLAQGDTPDVFDDHIPAELVGWNREIPEGHDPGRWDRMKRCVYDETRKIEWDSANHCQVFELNRERPSWQQKTDENVTIPEWATVFFDIPIEEYKEHAKQSEEARELNSVTKTRLEDLGYL